MQTWHHSLNCGSNSIPGLGTSICCWCDYKKEKESGPYSYHLRNSEVARENPKDCGNPMNQFLISDPKTRLLKTSQTEKNARCECRRDPPLNLGVSPFSLLSSTVASFFFFLAFAFFLGVHWRQMDVPRLGVKPELPPPPPPPSYTRVVHLFCAR